jgi:uncharacterized protein YyaL (SSP411 family)
LVSNRLAHETSPYLLQHQDNPVDWYPWGPEALERARAQDQPLLVSIGYSACHWCHVMAHESFEDPEVAALMNERFVCIKVDREERPDVDAMYMEAAQAMTGHGGWPLNAFLSPDLVPFFAGTYFPPEPRQGLPSWRMVLLALSDAWRERREEISLQGEEIMRSLNATARLEPSPEAIREEPLTDAVAQVVRSHDSAHGGWGSAPKFPQASVIELLLARGEAEVATAALEAMAKGGIYDHVGGGFARYSVDATWTVPHFEKMLYDNGLLARAYLHGWQVSGRERLRRVCTETLDWALREMRGPEGGFYSALDADSEGVEGKFYVWTEDELRQVLGPLYEQAVAYFGPRPFEAGAKVLEGRGPEPERLPEIRCQLYGARSKRVRPGTDDKRLTAWNALMISALADAGAVLGRDDYLDAAVGCADFLLARGRVRTDHIPAFLDDYAYLLEALLTLYEATFEPRWYREAVATADTMIERFGDPERGGFFTTAEGQSELPVRRKDLEDSPIPSGNSSAALGLLRLAALSGQRRYEEQALGVLRLLFGVAARHPLAFGHLLRAADFYLASVREVAIVGPEPEAEALVGVVREQLRPHLVLAGGAGDGVPLLEGRGPVDGQAAAYVCEHFACQAPVTRPDELRAMLTGAPAAA